MLLHMLYSFSCCTWPGPLGDIWHHSDFDRIWRLVILIVCANVMCHFRSWEGAQQALSPYWNTVGRGSLRSPPPQTNLKYTPELYTLTVIDNKFKKHNQKFCYQKNSPRVFRLWQVLSVQKNGEYLGKTLQYNSSCRIWHHNWILHIGFLLECRSDKDRLL